MDYSLSLVFALLINMLVIRIIMEVLARFGIDFVGFFQNLWKKLKKQRPSSRPQ
ncbi:hypothetical protein H1S01_00910 [Heliobacterium chlorum]|uniref:Uncharacterized protein n=1 Tax=Heliobacterium chlorum TaxID=2698 RepID=A0ABR7SWZ0_HELCL|nr:hypothetical protein [Heliobacterium chlorum]MBC9783064.1 hypothetical protein [Heliobacterium chlorum]